MTRRVRSDQGNEIVTDGSATYHCSRLKKIIFWVLTCSQTLFNIYFDFVHCTISFSYPPPIIIPAPFFGRDFFAYF